MTNVTLGFSKFKVYGWYMTSFHDTAKLALRELEGCRDVLARTAHEQWQQPTPCAGWDVSALGRHVAAAAWQQAEGFHRARIGVTDAPSWLEVKGDVVHTLDHVLGHLASALADADEE